MQKKYIWATIGLSLMSAVALGLSNTESHHIGQYLPNEGGVVFYLEPPAPLGDPAAHTGLIVALADACSACNWGSRSNNVSTSDELYSGDANTKQMLAQAGGSPVASACSSYTGGGHNDWYVPAQKELSALYANNIVVNAALTSNKGVALGNGIYWSSSQEIPNDTEDTSFAWSVDLGTTAYSGNQVPHSKDYKRLVRCVRVF